MTDCPHINIESLSFGALAAERDQDLKDYFVESESFKRLSTGQKSVVLGPRGSGKSAIFKMIAKEQRGRGAVVIELAPEDYSYELLRQVLATEGQGAWAKQGAYAAAWKYLLYVLSMKAVSTSRGTLRSGSAGRIYTYLRDNHANFHVNPIGVLISYLKRLEGFKLGSYEAGVKSRELHKLYKLEEVEPLLDDLNAVCSTRQAIVLVDELDRGWDASEDAIAFVAGLFQAAVAVNNRVPNLRVIISLRKELYDNIPALYEDAQKIRDLIETIEWDEPQILELIARRIAHSFPDIRGSWHEKTNVPEETRQANYHEIWNLVFADTLDYRKTKSFNYMIDRTLYRPREIIQFCSDVRQKGIDIRHSPPFNYGVISSAEHGYSEARLKDIAAEYRLQYPGLLSVFETFRGKAYNITRDELEVHCLEMSVNDLPVDQEARRWCSEMEPEGLIEMLWRVGFIRAQAVGGMKGRRRSGSSYLGSHQIASLNLANIGRFHVHPMFREFLGLKESKAAQED